MPVKRTGVQEVEIALIEANPLSANVEDGATFSRLRSELKEHGMLELPVMLKNGTKFRVIAGHHRVEAWSQLGHATTDAIVVEGKLTKEEEFNLVNNLNTIHGGLSVSRVKRVVRQAELDVTKLDLFKYPLTRLMPGATKPIDGPAQRRAKIRDMSLRIASKVAEVLLDDMNAAVVCFRVEDQPVAVVRLNLTKQSARKNISTLKSKVRKSLKEWLDT